MNDDRLAQSLNANLPDAVRHDEPPAPGGSDAELLQPQLRPAVYEWSVRLLSLVRRMLAINIKLHGPRRLLADGDIYLFNHFARFETFIPQYLIYLETGAYCRSVASGEFFAPGDRFGNYLLNVGAVPNDHVDLLAFLGAEVLRGRKVVIFPEGGMVKDRRVQDASGRYSVYSRSSATRRPHHSGAAVLATALTRFKSVVLQAAAAGRASLINRWARTLALESGAALVAAARRPTRLVPANITFYPIRVDNNMLQRGAAIFARGLSPRALEELLIEGNLLLRHTDMDIRLGEPLTLTPARPRLRAPARALGDAEFRSYFRQVAASGWWQRRQRRGEQHAIDALRDRYMHAIYARVTVNLSHLAAQIIMRLIDAGVTEIDQASLRRTLYLAVKYAQGTADVALHRSLRNPESYQGLLDTDCSGLEQFVETSAKIGLIEARDGVYRFLPKLCDQHAFDEIRLENPIAVYANEVAPATSVVSAVTRALREAAQLSAAELALLRFDDEQVAHAWDLAAFSKPRHAEVNAAQTASRDPAPFLLRGGATNGRPGVLLAHGFLASPAEVRGLGARLHAAGYSVLGVRLKGHGTSPWDLNERSWEDWLGSLRRGFEVLRDLCGSVCLVGFSAGGTLALRLAAERPQALVGAVTIAAPLRFRERKLALIPLVHGANQLVRWVKATEGVSTFHPNDPENPDINYRHIPIRGLWELRRLVEDVRRNLPRVEVPLLVIQGDADPVVDPASADAILAEAGSASKQRVNVAADWHGIIFRDPGSVADQVLRFLGDRAGAAVPLAGEAGGA